MSYHQEGEHVNEMREREKIGEGVICQGVCPRVAVSKPWPEVH